ncbi:MAG: hypothetical protein WBN63_01310 [Eudoraea sp.]|uniref:hypothetical protein n=1 Tax=Eudoraea sp. TaxID=1979955 RepID=UPI003C70D7B2
MSNTDEFDYLIGMEYSELSELKELQYKSRVGLTKDDIETTSTSFVKGNNQIITSESVRIDTKSNQKVYKILDIIVLNGYYASCEGCLLSNKKNVTIKTFHPLGKTVSDSIIVAFEKNYSTGIFRSVDPNNYKLNPKSYPQKKD